MSSCDGYGVRCVGPIVCARLLTMTVSATPRKFRLGLTLAWAAAVILGLIIAAVRDLYP